MAKAGSKLNGSLARDNNNEAIQTCGSFVTQDATAGTTLKSPLAYTTAVTALVVPDNAVSVVFTPTTAINVSNNIDGNSTLVSAPYYTQTATLVETYPCAKVQTIYFAATTTNGTLNFKFLCV